MELRKRLQGVKTIPKQMEFVITVSVIAILIALVAIAISIDTKGKQNAN